MSRPRTTRKRSQARKCVDAIVDQLFPGGDTEHAWTVEDLDAISDKLRVHGFGPLAALEKSEMKS